MQIIGLGRKILSI